jgi:hypothetical protein
MHVSTLAASNECVATALASALRIVRPGVGAWREVGRLASALLIVALLCGCQTALPAGTVMPTAPATAVSTEPVTPPAAGSTVASPAPVATPCSKPTPSLVPALVFQNGNLDLNVPYRLGFVQFNLVPCRDIDLVRAKYGLGSAERVIAEPPSPNSDPDDVRGRYYRASVPVGAEAAFVTRLAAHPEDFQYVEFAMIIRGCAVGGSGLCRVSSTIEPKEGPTGTSFKMEICCFDPGMAVTKTFTLPSGRTIVIADRAGQNGELAAGWGGSAGDERGLYTVTVTSDQIGSIVRFRID